MRSTLVVITGCCLHPIQLLAWQHHHQVSPCHHPRSCSTSCLCCRCRTHNPLLCIQGSDHAFPWPCNSQHPSSFLDLLSQDLLHLFRRKDCHNPARNLGTSVLLPHHIPRMDPAQQQPPTPKRPMLRTPSLQTKLDNDGVRSIGLF